MLGVGGGGGNYTKYTSKHFLNAGKRGQVHHTDHIIYIKA